MHPREKPPTCQGCPAYEWGVGFVPPEIPPAWSSDSSCSSSGSESHTRGAPALQSAGGAGVGRGRVALVGQGPGETEAKFSRPFHPNAPSGGLLTGWLYKAHTQRSQVLLTNVVWCWLPERKPRGFPVGNREPTAQEVSFCRERYLDPLLAKYLGGPRDVVVAVGAAAARTLLDDKKVDRHMGTMVWRNTTGSTPPEASKNE